MEKELELTRRELERRENEIHRKIQEVMRQETASKDRSFQDMKEVADRVLKLADASKKGSGNGQYLGLAVILAEVVRIIVAK